MSFQQPFDVTNGNAFVSIAFSPAGKTMLP